MNLNAPVQNRSAVSIVAVLALGFLAIYSVPFYVPVHDGLSFSYLFGFSNRTAIALLVVFILGFALWTRGLGLSLPDPSTETPDSFRLAGRIAVACSVAGALVVWLCAALLAPLAEAQYFLDRFETYRMGGQLYRTFEFDYGPLMFYPPIWIARALHISLGNGHYIAWTLQCALGTWVLWKTVAVAARGTRHGRTIFLLFWAFFFAALIDSGPNYTPLRFCGTLLFALGTHQLYSRGASFTATFGLASVGAAAMLFYSPEQGVALTIGTVLFFLICARPGRPGTLAGLAAFVLVMAAIFCIGFRLGLLNNLRTVGGGALNFPLLFSFQTLVLLSLETVAGCIVIAAFRKRKSLHPLLYLICISAVTIPAAFSRADVGHILLNTLGALLAALIVLSQYPAIWRWTWPCFAVVILTGFYVHVSTFRPVVREHVMTTAFGDQMNSPAVEKAYTAFVKLTNRNPEARIAQLRAQFSHSPAPNTPRLPFHAYLYAPLGVERRISPFAGDPQIVTGYYPWLSPMTSSSMIQKKISEIEIHPDWPSCCGIQPLNSAAQTPPQPGRISGSPSSCPIFRNPYTRATQANLSATTSTPTMSSAPTPLPCPNSSSGFAKPPTPDRQRTDALICWPKAVEDLLL